MAKTHGMRHAPEYNSWCGIRRRCQDPDNPKYPSYGGRGIKVCDRWASFDQFFADMGPRPSPHHTIDRIDNNGPYAPDNCRWATKSEQNLNRKNNHQVTIGDKTQPLTVWAWELGIDPKLVFSRVSDGWTYEEALALRPHKRKTRVYTGWSQKNNRFLTHNGKTQTLTQWSRETGIAHSTLRRRINAGWTIDAVLTVKPKP